ncbi:Kelch-type beta propeller domain containing protein [Gracilaria domingensis]|nr:Kelch-type beta propeller domain containing protein [Gracilaria domingensis]
MHHFQAVQGPDNCVWVVGAWTGPFPAEDTVDNLWRYCPDSDEWFKDVNIARPRGAGGTFFYNGKLYLVTGNVGGHRAGAKVVPWFDSYDPTTGEWEELPDMPNPRDHCNAVVLGSKVYVTGGRRSTSDFPEFFDDTVAEVDVFDFATSEWSTLTELSRPRGGTAAAVLGGTVYVMGGEGDNRAWTEVDVLKGSSFEPGPSLPEPRHGTGIVSCSGAIWIAGGERVIGAGDPATDTYALYDGDELPVCRGSAPSAPTASPSSSSSEEISQEISQEPSPVSSPSPSPDPTHESKETQQSAGSSAPNDTASGAVGADEIDASSTPSSPRVRCCD